MASANPQVVAGDRAAKIGCAFFALFALVLLADARAEESAAFKIVNAAAIEKCDQGDGSACWWLGLLKRNSGDRTGEIGYYERGCGHGYGKACFRLSTYAEQEGDHSRA